MCNVGLVLGLKCGQIITHLIPWALLTYMPEQDRQKTCRVWSIAEWDAVVSFCVHTSIRTATFLSHPLCNSSIKDKDQAPILFKTVIGWLLCGRSVFPG